MRKCSSLLGSSGMAMGLTVAAIAIAAILLSSNFTVINAQSQQVTSQAGEIENGTTATTTTFQSTNDDSFSIQVPEGWVIHDENNTGSALLEERTQGYAILAQLCPEEQQRAIPSNASDSISGVNTSSCQGAQDVIHIIRYPDLDTRLLANNVTTNDTITTIDNILTYHLQKLQEVGYRSMRIINSTDVTLNLRNPETNETMTTEPGKFVEMRYSTNVTPDETRRGYFILTYTNTTAPYLGTTTGYSVFYEGNATSTATAAEITTAAASLPPPPSIAQLFDSFELIAAAEVAQAIEDVDDDDDDNGGDDDDDNGGDDDDDNGNGDDNGGDGDDDNGGDGDDDNGDDDNGGDGDDDNGDNGEGGEGEGGEGEGNPNEFEDCEVVGGGDVGDVGC